MRIGHEEVSPTVECKAIPQPRLIYKLLRRPTGGWNLPEAAAGHSDEDVSLLIQPHPKRECRRWKGPDRGERPGTGGLQHGVSKRRAHEDVAAAVEGDAFGQVRRRGG